MIMAVLNYLDDVLYYPILMVILIAAGLIFSWKTRCVQLRLFPESIRVVMEKPTEAGKVFPGPYGFDGVPCRYGQYYRRIDGNLPGWSRRCLLDVAPSHHRRGDGLY